VSAQLRVMPAVVIGEMAHLSSQACKTGLHTGPRSTLSSSEGRQA
jgi:hypothetical protein